MDQVTLDALTKLVAEIAKRLRTVTLTALPEARLMQLVNEPVFAPNIWMNYASSPACSPCATECGGNTW